VIPDKENDMRASALLLVFAAWLTPASLHHTNVVEASVAVRRVAGRIVDAETGAPLPHVKATIGGVALGGESSDRGTFELRDVPSGAKELVLQHPCYLQVRVALPAEDDVEVRLGLPFDQTSRRRAGCGGLGARKDSPGMR